MKDAVAILCAGGPAPGINTVISSVTKVFINNLSLFPIASLLRYQS